MMWCHRGIHHAGGPPFAEAARNVGTRLRHDARNLAICSRRLNSSTFGCITFAEHARHVIDSIEAGYRAAETGQTQDLRTSFEPLPIEAL